MRRKLLVAGPLALVLVASTALWVQAADNDVPDRACADIIGGEAAFQGPVETIPGAPQAGVAPARLSFSESLAAPSCVDVQYGLVVLAQSPEGAAPVVLSSQVVPGDGISSEIQFDLQQVTVDPDQTQVCVYLYTMGSSGGSTTTPSNGNPHSQTITAAGMDMFDRAPDGTGQQPYCNKEGEGTTSRGYN